MKFAEVIGIVLSIIGILVGIYFGVGSITKHNVKLKNVGNVKAKSNSNVILSNIKIGNIENGKKSGE